MRGATGAGVWSHPTQKRPPLSLEVRAVLSGLLLRRGLVGRTLRVSRGLVEPFVAHV